jgi:hypothetical protein
MSREHLLNILLFPDGGISYLFKKYIFFGRSDIFKKKRFFIIKANLSSEGYQGMLALFPGVKFFHIVRGARDVVKSRQLFQGFSHETYLDSCRAWNEENRSLLYLRHAENTFFCHYEELQNIDSYSQKFESIFQISAQRFFENLNKNVFHPTTEWASPYNIIDKAPNILEKFEYSEVYEQNLIEICGQTMLDLGYKNI